MTTIDNNKLRLTDDELLSTLFAKAMQPVPDNGFTDSVMLRIEAMQTKQAVQTQVATLTLKRWNFWLNAGCAAAIIALLAYVGFFGQAWHAVQIFVERVLVSVLTFDPDTLLVRALLAIRQVVETLPSVGQTLTLLLGLGLLWLILMGQALQKLAKSMQ